MKPKRILIFSLVYYPRFIGGAEVAVKEITDRIDPKEIEFDLVTLRLDRSLPRFERIGNVNVYRVGYSARQKNSSDSLPWYLHFNKYLMIFTAFLKANALEKQRNYDAIWSIMATYNSFAALFFKIFHPKISFILTLQEGDPLDYIKRRALPLYPLFKRIFTKADKIQAISTFLADWAKEMGAKVEPEVIPNAVDYEHFNQIHQKRKEELLRQFDKKDSEIFLITTSRLVIKNAVADIVQALTFLPSNVKLLVLGQGYEENNLKAQISNLKLAERVRMLGYVSHKEMPAYLHISDIFVRPSLSEGLGNSFLEAMAAGLPVIATPVGGIPDFLKDGETGLFCEVRNPRSIAQKVEKFIKDKELREHIVRQARELVRNNYEWTAIAKKMKDILIADKL